MGKSSKKSKKVEESESNSEFEKDEILNEMSDDAENFDDDSDNNNDLIDKDNEVDHDDSEDESGEQEEEEEEDEEGDQEEEEEEREKLIEEQKNAEMEEIEKEIMELKHKEQDLLKNLTRHKDEDLLKGQAVKNQKALWDKTLELRFLLQKAFSNSNRLPQEPIRSSFCDSEDTVKDAYLDLLASSRKTLDSILELQEVLLEKNPSITQSMDGKRSKPLDDSVKSSEIDEDWQKISEMHSRMASFSTYAAGALYWLGFKESHGELILVSLDLGSERFEQVLYPENLGKPCRLNLAALGDCLCLLAASGHVVTRMDVKNHVDVWVMKAYGVEQSWVKLFTVEQLEGRQHFSYMRPIAYSMTGGEVLLEMDNRKFLWYNLEKKSLKHAKIGGGLNSFESFVNFGTLVPLYGRGNEKDSKA